MKNVNEMAGLSLGPIRKNPRGIFKGIYALDEQIVDVIV